MKKTKSHFFILKIIIIAIIILFASTIAANWYIHFIQPGYQNYQYTIRIHNASFYKGSPVTDILVPLPIKKETQVFPETRIQGKVFKDWKSVLVITNDGKMLALQSIGGNLTDISSEFTMSLPIDNDSFTIEDVFFSPALNTSDNAVSSSSVKCPAHSSSTFIFLPVEIYPLSDNVPPLVIEIELMIYGDRIGFEYMDDYRLYGAVPIPTGTKGKIPISINTFYRQSSIKGGNGNWSCLT